MKTLTIDLPTMYGDHHVIDVRRMLLEMAGIEDVNASSAFHAVEVSYDPDQVTAEAITTRLGEAGYLEPMVVPLETGQSAYQQDASLTYYRHTAAYSQTGRTVSFAQTTGYTTRPLWPCPGMGPIRTLEEEE